MIENHPENGRMPAASGPALTRMVELILFLERLDRARQSQWQKLLGLQAEQLRLLASFVETMRVLPGAAEPAPLGMVPHRNARERASQPMNENSALGRR